MKTREHERRETGRERKITNGGKESEEGEVEEKSDSLEWREDH